MTLQQILKTIIAVWSMILAPLLNLLYALILLVIGLIIARLLQWVVAYVLKTVQLDKGCQQIKLTPLLQKGEIRKAPSDLLGDLVYWIVIFITIVSVPSVLGLRVAGKLVSGVLAYVPAVLAAALVLGIAMFIAVVLAGIVLVIANNAGLSNSKTLAKIVQYAVIIFGFVVALGQLGIDAKLIVASFSVVVGGVALAFAIAFGLGCKDMAADFLSNLFKGK